MATSKYTITLEWENGVGFQMKSQENAEGVVTVVKVDENAHYPDIRPDIDSICETYFAKTMKKVSDEMVS